MNKAEFLADLKDPEYHASLVANESVRVISYPNVAIVVGTYHTKGKYKRQAFEHYGRFTDTGFTRTTSGYAWPVIPTC